MITQWPQDNFPIMGFPKMVPLPTFSEIQRIIIVPGILIVISCLLSSEDEEDMPKRKKKSSQ